ncbi:MAG: putative spermidine/putrescine transport system ATP-binding protein [Thermoleophilaceae bacterium]|nr:putative spermidine/putrescine transport system ATP-binding protein [Thermoleophilaceae bacterium]MEA2351931.1 putative spermidine/putrescine transport system ATP-binding protein [Thermoleophilaceae bacterium]MEA2368930.1 putative spermidine/putrescine transport system ATP-binding protein [Thermoleophilaceae bacterium]
MERLTVSESSAAAAAPHESATPPDVRLVGLRKAFGDVAAVDGVDLEIAAGEFFTLLGPSGSGKTTTLRLIAGFERPDGGRVELGGVDVSGQPPYQRDVNTVFQDYALFPHMDVADNVAYGLRVKKIAKAERAERVADALRMVQLEGFGERRPVQLSGGQRQRVALARAIVNRPRVLLLDEPLGALDLKLRQQMQLELGQIQDRVGITFVYVTHDQDEALAMSDRIAVFNDGRIEQVAPPADLYERPATPFVAGFVGTSNVIERDGRRFTLRPEKIRLADPNERVPDGYDSAPGTIRDVVYLGMVTRYFVELDDGARVVAVAQNLETSSQDALEQRDRAVRVWWRRDHTFKLESQQGGGT